MTVCIIASEYTVSSTVCATVRTHMSEGGHEQPVRARETTSTLTRIRTWRMPPNAHAQATGGAFENGTWSAKSSVGQKRARGRGQGRGSGQREGEGQDARDGGSGAARGAEVSLPGEFAGEFRLNYFGLVHREERLLACTR